MANTSLVAASAIAAGNDFFDPSSIAVGSVANNQSGTTPPTPITSATALSGTAGSDSLSTGFANGDFINVNGTAITFSTSSPTSLTGPNYNINPTTGTVGNLLSAIDSITGTSTPSSIDGGAVTLHTDNAANFSISGTTANATSALAALGFSTSPITAVQPPLRVPSPASTATTLVNGSATTVAWYTGNSSADPRASSTARIDSGITVDYGAQANEQAIRQQIEGVAVYAAVSFSPTATNSAAAASALSSRIAANLTSKPGQQTISDIQTDFAAAQTQMQAASARQTQTQSMLQNLVELDRDGFDRSGRKRDPATANDAVGVLPDDLDPRRAKPDQVPGAGRLKVRGLEGGRSVRAAHKAFVNHSCLLLLTRVNAALAAVGSHKRSAGQGGHLRSWNAPR